MIHTQHPSGCRCPICCERAFGIPGLHSQIDAIVQQDKAMAECPQEYLIRWIARFIEDDDKPLNRLQCAVRFMDAVMDAFDKRRAE